MQSLSARSRLSNDQLELALKQKSAAERKLTIEVIELLEEMDRRKLFLERGYSSLIEYCIKELKYSESSAYRRVAAMRVAREIPETKVNIENGSLNLAVVAQAQGFFCAEARDKKTVSIETKKEILRELEGKSTRETEKLLAERAPTRHTKDRVRAVSGGKREITITVSAEFYEKLERIKSRLSHQIPGGELAKIFECLIDKEIARIEKVSRVSSASPTAAPKVPEDRSRYVSRSLKAEVWTRSHNRCCYVDLKTGRRCSSTKFLEIDHLWPRSRGGRSTLDNLQLLCDAHNRLKSDWPS